MSDSLADRARLLLFNQPGREWVTSSAVARALRIKPTQAHHALQNLLSAGGPDHNEAERRYLTAEEIRAGAGGLLYAYRLTAAGRAVAQRTKESARA